MTTPFKVLISGSGVTGPVLAFHLSRFTSHLSRPLQITVLEKAPSTPLAGQGLDIEGSARDVVNQMGPDVMETMRSKSTGEKGFSLIDRNNKPYATWHESFVTNEIEIMRGDMIIVLTEAAKQRKNVEFRYSRFVTNIQHLEKSVKVRTSSSDGKSAQEEEEYHAVIACDGVRSSTRDLIFNDPKMVANSLAALPVYSAYFSIPAQPQDYLYSRLQHAIKGRIVWIRPHNDKISSVYLIATGQQTLLSESLKQRGQAAKRQAWIDTIKDINYGEFPRMVAALKTSDNFYADQITQVKLPAWSKGRCAVVGDAAYAPSPLTGEGVQLSCTGAYILAGELAKNLDDPAAAFQAYEKVFRKDVEEAQKIPFGGKLPLYICPQSWWGIKIVQSLFWLVASSRVWKAFAYFGEKPVIPLPKYEVREE